MSEQHSQNDISTANYLASPQTLMNLTSPANLMNLNISSIMKENDDYVSTLSEAANINKTIYEYQIQVKSLVSKNKYLKENLKALKKLDQINLELKKMLGEKENKLVELKKTVKALDLDIL